MFFFEIAFYKSYKILTFHFTRDLHIQYNFILKSFANRNVFNFFENVFLQVLIFFVRNSIRNLRSLSVFFMSVLCSCNSVCSACSCSLSIHFFHSSIFSLSIDFLLCYLLLTAVFYCQSFFQTLLYSLLGLFLFCIGQLVSLKLKKHYINDKTICTK